MPEGVKYKGHLARLIICPIERRYKKNRSLAASESCEDRRSMLKMRFERRFVIVGVDRCVQVSVCMVPLCLFCTLSHNVEISQ